MALGLMFIYLMMYGMDYNTSSNHSQDDNRDFSPVALLERKMGNHPDIRDFLVTEDVCSLLYEPHDHPEHL